MYNKKPEVFGEVYNSDALALNAKQISDINNKILDCYNTGYNDNNDTEDLDETEYTDYEEED